MAALNYFNTPYAEAFATNLGQLGVFSPNIQEIAKALSTGTVVDPALMTGGGALRTESLDSMLRDMLYSEKHVKLFNILKTRQVESTVNQYTVVNDYGAPWGAVSAEGQNPVANDSDLERKLAYVKFFRTLRSVTHEATMVSNIENIEAVEEARGTKFLLGQIERALFYGDSSVVPENIDGLLASVVDAGYSDNIIDMEGAALDDEDYLHDIGDRIGNYGGIPTHIFMDPHSKSDLNKAMTSAERFVVNNTADHGRAKVGIDIGSVDTSWGEIALVNDLFLAPHQGWFTETTPLYQAPTVSRGGDSTNAVPDAPTAVTAAAAGTGGTVPTGSYRYRVSAINCNGESASALCDAVAVTLGEVVTLTITSTDSDTTGFRIYRSEKDSTAAGAECRFLYHCAVTDGGTTTFEDDGTWIPGCTSAFALDLSPDAPSAEWIELMGMSKLALALLQPALRWLQMIYGGLQCSYPHRIVLVKNILPSRVALDWTPI